MYKQLIILVFALSVVGQATAQEARAYRFTPSFAIKNNLLFDATASPNLGIEFKTGERFTLEIAGSYNPFVDPWKFSNENRKWKHILVQPELRWWICEPFNGHFFGLHAHYAIYNVGGVKLPKISFSGGAGSDSKNYRYEGWLAGAGISYGYQFYLGRRWNLEATIGAGYAYLDYDRYECGTCGDFDGAHKKHYFGLTKAGISLIYLIK